jgi:hypothetical protein
MKATIRWLEGRWISFINGERLESTGIADIVDQTEEHLAPSSTERIVWKALNDRLIGMVEEKPQGKLSKSDNDGRFG